MLEAGAQAPDFELKDLGGGSLRLSRMLARGPVLLAFFKVSCPVCQFTFPFLERMYEGAGRDQSSVHFAGISQDMLAATRSFNQEFGITFATLVDEPDYPVSNAYGIQIVPSLFLIEQDGTIALAAHGFSKKDLEALGHRAGVQPFRAGESVPEFRPG